MSEAVIGALRVVFGADTAAFEKGVGEVQKKAARLEKDFVKLGQRFQGIGQSLSMSLTPALVAMGAAAVKGANDQAQAMAQVEAALKSMGGASGKTAEELLKTSDALEMKSLYDGDVILRDVTANLLTFGNVAGEVFDKAQQAALDMATRLGSDPKAAAIMLGKALNDPIKGITALTRVGVSFTEQQKAQITAMAEAGDVAGAQGLILAELEKQYGGAAAAAADTSPWRQAQVAIGQVGDVIGEILIPFIRSAAEYIKGFAEWFKGLSPTVQSAAVALGAFGAVIGPLMMGLGLAVQAMAPFLGAIGAIGSSGGAVAAANAALAGLGAALGPILPIVAAVAAAGVVLYTQWDKIKPVLEQVAKGMQEALGPKVTALVESFKGAMMKMQPLFDLIGDVLSGFFKIMGPIWTATFASAIDIVSGFVGMVGDLIGGVIKLLTGDIDGAVDSFKSAFRAGFDTVLKIFGNFWTATKQIFANFGVNLVQIGKDMIAGLVRGIREAGPAVLNALLGVAKDGVLSVKKYLGIRSPSRLFMEIGGFMVEGLVLGIENSAPRAIEAIKQLTRAVCFKMSDEMKVVLNSLSTDSKDLFDRLFPEKGKREQYFKDKRTIAKAPGRSEAEKAEALARLQKEYLSDFAGAVFDRFSDLQEAKFKTIRDKFVKLGKSAQKDMANPVARAVEVMARTVQDAASAIGNALRGLGDAFKNGGFWDKLGAIADLIGAGAQSYGQISSALNGGGSSPTANSLSAISSALAQFGGARAVGGNVAAGRSYWVGEKGPELFMPSTGGRIYANDNSASMSAVRVEIVDTTQLFETRVTQTAAGVTSQGIGALESRRGFSSRRSLR